MLSDTALMWTRIGAGISLFLVANFAYGIFLQSRKQRGGKSWLVAPGEIILSRADEMTVRTAGESFDRSVEIRYRYRAGAKDYEGHRVRFGQGGTLTALQADELTGKYPQGAHVDVHYNPQRPSESVLEPDDRGNIAALIAMLVVFSVISAVLVAHSIAGKVLTTEAGVPLFAFLLPIAAIGFGIAGLVGYFKLRREQQASARWPTATGTITQSSVETEVEQEEDDRGRERSELVYRVALQFAYRVGAREFHSTHWNWGWTALHSDRSRAEEVVAKYPVGRQVTVYYDPAQPETAVLEPANKVGVAAPLLVGLFLIPAGLVFLWAFTHLA